MAFGIGSAKNIDYNVNLIDKTQATRQKISQGFQGLDKSAQQAAGGGNMFASALGNIGTVAAGVLSANLIGGLVSGVQGFLGASVNASNELSRALTTLEIVAPRFGVNADAAKASAQALGKELRIGVGPAAAGLQNLLKSGLNLDQAETLMKRFTNEAITGKSSTISLAQAVENLSFSFTTENSALGNLSGISENYNNLIERGAQLMGKRASDLTESERAQAKYQAMIELTNLTMGSAEKFTGTLIDKQAELDLKIQDLQVSIGEKLSPVLAKLVDKFAEFLDKHGDKLIEIFSILIERVAGLIDWLMPMIDLISQWIAQNPELAAGIANVVTAIAGLFILANIIGLVAGLISTVGGLIGAFGGLVAAIPGVSAALAGLSVAGGPILAIAAAAAIAVVAIGKLIYELNRLGDAQAAAAEAGAVAAGRASALGARKLQIGKDLRAKGYTGPLGGLTDNELGKLAAKYKVNKPTKHAAGADFITNGSQMIEVGDNFGGKERVQVTPISSPNYNGPSGVGATIGTVNIILPNFSGNARALYAEIKRLAAADNLNTRLGANRAL